MLARATLIATLTWMAACQPARQSSPVERTRVVSPAGDNLSHLWVFYGGETEPFCVSLSDDSTGRFYGGFASKNPLHWRYDSLSRRLDIRYSHLTADDYFVLRDGLARGRFVNFDSLTSTASYVLDPAKPRLNVFGWVLEPSETLEDWKKPFAKKGCPLLADAGGA